MNYITILLLIISAQKATIMYSMHGLGIQVVLEAFALQIGDYPTQNLNDSSNQGCKYCRVDFFLFWLKLP